MIFNASIDRLQAAICLNKRKINYLDYNTEGELVQIKNEIAEYTRAIDVLKDNEI